MAILGISNYPCILIILLQYIGCWIFSSHIKLQQHEIFCAVQLLMLL